LMLQAHKILHSDLYIDSDLVNISRAFC
jgi:hypothetical protein